MTRLIPAQLRCEYLVEPLALDARRPRLSWLVECADRDRQNARQTACRIVVTHGNGTVVWDSPRVTSAETLHIGLLYRPSR